MTTATITHTTLRAEGFSCPSCVAKTEKAPGALPGVTKAATSASCAATAASAPRVAAATLDPSHCPACRIAQSTSKSRCRRLIARR